MSAKSNSPCGSSARRHREQSAAPDPVQRRYYRPPVLAKFGDVRGLTLGGSPGTGDSGGAGMQRIPEY